MADIDPVVALTRIAYLLERDRQPTYRVQAFRKAADVIARLDKTELAELAQTGRLQSLPGIGKTTAGVISQALDGDHPQYLAQLEQDAGAPEEPSEMRALLRGDLHTHSDWSDGGSPIVTMAMAARELGHEYIALTDHSPRLTIANGLSPQRLREQLDQLQTINRELAPFRILPGIEVDILDDGGLDQEPELLARLDVVVASVHSKLRMPGAEMTPRMINAISNPLTNILGHCTGRIVVGRGRPQSEFDPAVVFAACAEHQVAVEINSRPERLDPPIELLRIANDCGCLFSIDTDAHAPGQLEWQENGCKRAAEVGIDPQRVINTWPAARLLEWTHGKR